MTDKLFRLLRDYRPKTFGLTIPFILGALRQPVGQVLPSAESFEELRALLVALRDNIPNPLKAQISQCQNLEEPIIALLGTQVDNSIRFESPSTQDGALYVRLYGVYDDDFESLVDNLWKRYEGFISKGQFSRRDNQWKPFSSDELTNLKKCFGIE